MAAMQIARRNWFIASSKSMFRSFPRTRESRSFFPWPWIPAFAGMSGIDVESIPPDHALVQLPISAGFDRQREPYQCRFLEVAPDQHQADRQIIDAAAWHGEGGMPGNVERAGVGLHVERGIDRGVERRVARRDRRRRKGYRRHRQHVI